MIERDTIWKKREPDMNTINISIRIGRLGDVERKLYQYDYKYDTDYVTDTDWRSARDYIEEETVLSFYYFTGRVDRPENNKVENVLESFESIEDKRLLRIEND